MGMTNAFTGPKNSTPLTFGRCGRGPVSEAFVASFGNVLRPGGRWARDSVDCPFPSVGYSHEVRGDRRIQSTLASPRTFPHERWSLDKRSWTSLPFFRAR